MYLGDVVSLPTAFITSALVSIFITCAYSRKVLGSEFTFRRLMPAQLLYLVIFSSAFLVEGFTGLPLVCLFIFTLHLAMQVTAKIDWERVEGAKQSTERN